MRLFIKIWCFLTLQKAVALRDFDGDVCFRPAKKTPFGLVAKRQWPFNIRNVILNDDGTVSNGSYVEEWKDL